MTPYKRDPTAQLLADMAEFGLDPGDIIWDGRKHRFPGANKTRGTDAWYFAFIDREGARYGDFSTGVNEHWILKGRKKFSRHERDKWAAEKRKRDREQVEARELAEKEVKAIWKAAKPVDPKFPHPYLYNKGIDTSPGLRISTLVKVPTPEEPNRHIPAGLLLVPMLKRGKVVNIQRIWPKGEKYVWRGAENIGARHLIASGDDIDWGTIYMVEGWTNGWTVHKATGCPVVVAFNTGNLKSVGIAVRKKYPEARIIIAADNDRWKKIKGPKGDIPNPGIYYAKRAAKEIDAEVAAPDFNDLGGRPTDFDDLRQREDLDAVRKYLDPKMLKKVATVAEPDPEEPDAEPEKDNESAWAEDASFRALGHDHGTYYLASELTGQVRDLSENQLGKSAAYYSLATSHFWEMTFPKDQLPYFTVELAKRAIIALCIKQGVFNTGRYRGRGVWRDDENKIVCHWGDRLLEPGAKKYSSPERFVDGDRIYPRLERMPGPASEKPFTLDEAQRLLGLFEDLSWESSVSGMLLAGWVVTAPFCGALRYRPHCWVTGPTECGKSTLLDRIVDPLLKCVDRIHREAHMTSEAAIRQKLRGDALPVILDEADMASGKAKRNIKGLFDLARSASTGGIVSKGSSEGTAVDFRVRSMFLFSSIVVGLENEQDKNRVVILPLQNPRIADPIKRRKKWGQIQRQMYELISPHQGRRLMARTMKWMRSGQFDKLLKVTAHATFNVMKTPRAAELYGTLLAGAWTLKVEPEDLPTIEEMTAWMKDMDLGLDEVAEKAAEQSYECLSIILQRRIPILVNHVKDRVPVGQLVDVIVGQVDEDAFKVKKTDAEQALRQRGLLIKDGYLCVGNDGQWLKALYKDTPFEAGWMAVLRNLPDVVVPGRSENAVQFYPGFQVRLTKIPLNSLSASTL